MFERERERERNRGRERERKERERESYKRLQILANSSFPWQLLGSNIKGR